MNVPSLGPQNFRIDTLALQRQCCIEADEIREKVEGILKQRAMEEADASMSDGQALLRASEILSWGKKGYELEMTAAFKNKPEIVPGFIHVGKQELTRNLLFSKELVNILLQKSKGADPLSSSKAADSLSPTQTHSNNSNPCNYLKA